MIGDQEDEREREKEREKIQYGEEKMAVGRSSCGKLKK